MVLIVDKNTGQRLSVTGLVDSDITYDAVSDSEALRNEDVVVLGSTTFQERVPNKLWGTRAWIEGNKTTNITSRGNIKNTHVTRQRDENIETKKCLFLPIKL